jgi:hypothetical protein
LARDFVLKTTDQLSTEETEQFLALFARVFPRSLSRNEFERKYLWTPAGHSYHGLMIADGVLVGAYSLIPYAYSFFGTKVLFGLSVDTMICEEHRGGPFNLLRMASLACGAAEGEGVGFVFGFPNDNAYKLTTRVLRWTDVGNLDFYVLPIRIGAIRPALWWANPLSRLGAGGFVRLPRLSSRDGANFGVEKVQDKRFEGHRYSHEHQIISLTGGRCVYRTCLEPDGVRTTYIIDVSPLTSACFAQAVRAVYRVVAGQTDLLLYVGRLPFRPAGLVRVPPAKRPRQIRMCGRILNRRLVDDRVLDLGNWNVNISNFDVR